MVDKHGHRHYLHTLASGFDERITLLVKDIPAWLAPIMTAASFVGLPIVIVVLAVIGGIMSWMAGQVRMAFALASTLAALGMNTIIKNIIDRPRPDTLYVENMRIHSYSFPSGHSFGSAVFYGLLAYLAYFYLPQPWNLVVPALLVLLILLVGISRVYLGAHFPSDVIAGWILGGISLFIIIIVFKP